MNTVLQFLYCVVSLPWVEVDVWKREFTYVHVCSLRAFFVSMNE
jgi:hypothetical protein